ncbi:MAG: SDR family NAD(P)-dependent oxidoreductase [Pseudomonadota bacterium]
MHKPRHALIVGAGGGLGAAIAKRWAADSTIERTWAVSRHADSIPVANKISPLATTHAADDIKAIVRSVTADGVTLSRVAIVLGTLHSESYAPEKSLRALAPEAMHEVYEVNCVRPLKWVAALTSALRKSPETRIAVFSARVGSISDNVLGGWYSYRCSKAALNMGLKTAAIELGRQAKGIKLIAFHPGTVDTALSKPFQRGVPEGKLFDADFVAERLDAVIEGCAVDGELSYVDWAGKAIPW